jgi:hypothetical protein
VLVCLGEECRCAVSLRAIVRYFSDYYKTLIELRRVIERYISSFPGQYDYSSVQLLPDRLFPQPTIPVVDGFRCNRCLFISQNRKAMREHVNKEHGKTREPDPEILLIVRIQSWFKGKRERYWVVDERAEGLYTPDIRATLTRAEQQPGRGQHGPEPVPTDPNEVGYPVYR